MKLLSSFVLIATSLVVTVWAVPVEEQQQETTAGGTVEREMRLKLHVTMATMEIWKRYADLSIRSPLVVNVNGIILNLVDYTKKRIDQLCNAIPDEPTRISHHHVQKEAQLTQQLVDEADKDLNILANRATTDVNDIAKDTGSDLKEVTEMLNEFLTHIHQAMKFELQPAFQYK